MSPGRFLLALTVTLAGCLLTEATSYPNTRRINKRICVTQVLARCPVRKKVMYKCDSRVPETFSNWNDRYCGVYDRKCCRHYVRVYVPCIITVTHCCAGWTTGATGRCNVPVPATDCHGGCDNNGTCDKVTGRCLCKPGFTGQRCERATCSPECENGGVCVAVDGTPQCKCPRAFRGPRCETAVCEEPCENGGNCTAVGTKAQCRCPEGFVGKRCEIVVKDGDCPVTSYFQHRNCSTEHRCVHDQQCPGQQKCCIHFDCRAQYCTDLQKGCHYKDKVFGIGEKFYPDPCKVCTCIAPGAKSPYGGAICSEIQCPPTPPGYQRCKRQSQNRGDNHCCKVCKDPEIHKPSNYTAPVFKNCPKDGIVLDLPKMGMTVKIPQTLEAVDMRSRKLEVKYSKQNLTWNSDLDRNFHLILATAVDDWEEVIECPFVVRLNDPHPPVFQTCPSDVGPVPGPRVTWSLPTAQDNVGLAGPPEGDFRPGQEFPVGQTLVTYTAEDVEGNEELCQFFVFVQPPSTTPTPVTIGNAGITDQLESSSGHISSETRLYIFLGLGFVLFLLILGGSIVVFLRRRRRSKRMDQTPSVAFSAPIDAPPPYSAVVQNTAVGLYENMAVKSLVTNSNPLESFDNPLYSTNDVAYNQQNNQNQASQVNR